MALLFNRRCVVIVDTVRVEGLRVSFKVVKTTKQEPNTCEVKIYNLSAATRGQLSKKAVPVVLSAGYASNAAVIFQGDSRTVDHLREGTEWITRVRCGDGERAYQWSRFSESFAPGTSVVTIIRAAAKALGVNTGNLEAELAKGSFRDSIQQFAHGYSAHGNAAREFDRLMRTTGFSWSIQNGSLQLLRDTTTATGQAILLTSDTGLIGSPEHNAPDKTGNPPLIKFKSLLQPRIRCGGIVQLQSVAVKGQFRCESIEHNGDTHGQEWYSSGEVRPY